MIAHTGTVTGFLLSVGAHILCLFYMCMNSYTCAHESLGLHICAASALTTEPYSPWFFDVVWLVRQTKGDLLMTTRASDPDKLFGTVHRPFVEELSGHGRSPISSVDGW